MIIWINRAFGSGKSATEELLHSKIEISHIYDPEQVEIFLWDIFPIKLILMIPLRLLSIFLGWRIWKEEQITLIHDYNYTRVAEEDNKPYTERIGKACIIIGIGSILTGIINFVTNTTYGWMHGDL